MDNQSLAHSRYNCTYHIVFIPKYRRKVMFGALRKEVGEILGKVCKMEGVTILKAATFPEHVHMYVSIPPKLCVSKTIGRIKGKSALMIFDRHPEYRERNNRHFWARGYYCETVGNVNEAIIKQYIEEQYERDRLQGDSEKQKKNAAFKQPPVTKRLVCQTAFRRKRKRSWKGYHKLPAELVVLTLNLALKFLLWMDMIMETFFRIVLKKSDAS